MRSTTSANRRRCAASSVPPPRPTYTNTSFAQGISVLSSDRRRRLRHGRQSPSGSSRSTVTRICQKVSRRWRCNRRRAPRAGSPWHRGWRTAPPPPVRWRSRSPDPPPTRSSRPTSRRARLPSRRSARCRGWPASVRSTTTPEYRSAASCPSRRGTCRTAKRCCSTGVCTPMKRSTAASTTWSAA